MEWTVEASVIQPWPAHVEELTREKDFIIIDIDWLLNKIYVRDIHCTDFEEYLQWWVYEMLEKNKGRRKLGEI